MYAGQCSAEYFESCLALRGELLAAGIDHTWLITNNESLVPRARNTSAARFLNDESLRKYDRFMFIDADIQFSPEDVAKLWNLDVDVACAAYRMKKTGAGLAAWKDGQLECIDDWKEPVSIDFAGTGFLMIKRHVFEKLIEAYPEMAHDQQGPCWTFFDTGVVDDGAGPYYISEDYDFCRKWRKLGGEIILEPTIKLGHVGRKIY